MRDKRFDKAVARILAHDKRYPARAYDLMPAVIDYTVRHPAPVDPGEPPRPQGHVSGRQLALGFRDYLLAEFGPFAADLLDEMNIRSTDDIGNLVYNLISVGIFGKTQSDSLSDFHAVYDFTEAFRDYYAPRDPKTMAEPTDCFNDEE
ncbi:MAG: Minf_1886 family protein [Candidatus Spyradenecus sp.]